MAQKICLLCSRPMQFVDQYSQWYCRYCDKYESELPSYTCPRCDSLLRFVPDKKEWCCDTCGTYPYRKGVPALEKVEEKAAPPKEKPVVKEEVEEKAAPPKEKPVVKEEVEEKAAPPKEKPVVEEEVEKPVEKQGEVLLVERNIKTTAGAVLIMLSGIFGLLLGGYLVGWGGGALPISISGPATIGFAVGWIVLGIIALTGGVFGILRKSLGMALFGGLCAILCTHVFIIGILGLILVFAGRKEFG